VKDFWKVKRVLEGEKILESEKIFCVEITKIFL